MALILAADEATRAIARERVRENVRRLGEMGQMRLEDVIAELERSRARIVSELARGTEFDQARARELLPAVEAEIRRLRDALRRPLGSAFRSALDLGDADQLEYARFLIGREAPLSQGVNLYLIDQAASRSADLVGQITETARAQINALLRRSAAGSSKSADVARALGDVLEAEARPTGLFGTLATQIERVHRTEVSALYEQAGKARTVQIARESPWVIEEVWITVLDRNTRQEHRDMNGAAVVVGEQFNYGAGPKWSKVSVERAEREGGRVGLGCTGPHDAILPAEAAVNCRCTRGMRRGPRKDGRESR